MTFSPTKQKNDMSADGRETATVPDIRTMPAQSGIFGRKYNFFFNFTQVFVSLILAPLVR
jgi:hypothetical protein